MRVCMCILCEKYLPRIQFKHNDITIGIIRQKKSVLLEWDISAKKTVTLAEV